MDADRKLAISKITTERPFCPRCRARMILAHITPKQHSAEQRVFECSKCDFIETVSVACDPMKSDATGWLRGELKPPI